MIIFSFFQEVLCFFFIEFVHKLTGDVSNRKKIVMLVKLHSKTSKKNLSTETDARLMRFDGILFGFLSDFMRNNRICFVNGRRHKISIVFEFICKWWIVVIPGPNWIPGPDWPVQLCPSPVKPTLQVQECEPTVFVHVAFGWQVSGTEHSLMSE